MYKRLAYIISIAFCVAITACNERAHQPIVDSTAKKKASLLNKDSLMLEYGRTILTAARDSDFQAISRFIHPREPLWFVPAGHIDVFSCQQLSAERLQHNAAGNVTLVWGNYEGTNQPIKMTPKEYFREFVYPADYLQADSIQLNKRFRQANSADNTAEIFPQTDYVAYFIARKTGKHAAMDCSSLRLVFRWEDETCFLLAIINDKWTIRVT